MSGDQLFILDLRNCLVGSMGFCVTKQESLEETSDDDTTALTENNEHKEISEEQNTAAISNGSNKSKKQSKVSCTCYCQFCTLIFLKGWQGKREQKTKLKS